MRKVGVLVAVGAALIVAGPTANAQQALGSCELPTTKPLWIDFADGSVPFWNMFAKPGVVAAAANQIYPAKLREGGARTVYFDLYFRNRVGIPNKPADPTLIDARADKFYDYAAQSMDCANPVIAENELFGAGLATPWSPANAQYRANVLRFLQRLKERGARPWLLVNSKPFTAGEAGDWWREVAKVAGVVREVYFPAPLISKQGPILGNRNMRQAFRRGILDFTETGFQLNQLGLFLGFQTGKGSGGREGLAAKLWYRTVKWQVLSARQVARQIGFNSIWSWGWGQWPTGGAVDPAKPAAACVYLWTRDARLCNGPKAAGRGFNADRSEGQLSLPQGIRCRLGDATIRWTAINPILKLTGDPELAFSNAFARAIADRIAPVRSGDILAAERSIVASRFGGSRGAYLAAIAEARGSLPVARGIIGDEVRRLRISSRLRASRPTAAQIADFYETYSEVSVRLVEAKTAVDWLGGRKRGYAVSSSAPGQLMTIRAGRWAPVWAPTGVVSVRPLGPSQPLSLVPLDAATAAIRAALTAQAREARFPAWIADQQRNALPEALCYKDQFPEHGEVDLTNYLPFLSLSS